MPALPTMERPGSMSTRGMGSPRAAISSRTPSTLTAA